MLSHIRHISEVKLLSFVILTKNYLLLSYLIFLGLLSLFGRYKERPLPPVNLAADFGGGGLLCALGITMALFEREKSGLGQVVDSSMVEGSAYLGSWFFRSLKVPGLWGQERGKNV